MNISKELQYPNTVTEHSAQELADAFNWYISLTIPYETLSNIRLGVFIKNPQEMLSTVVAGGGGHCVEHSVLLQALLIELGFDATLINADFRNHVTNKVVRISKPLVVVTIGTEMYVCDPYYRHLFLKLPAQGQDKQGNFLVTRESDIEFSIIRLKGEEAIDEDCANFEWSLEVRRKQFESRYQEFSPFGVTAPFYQILRPVRKAIFYSPVEDCLVCAEGDSYRYISESDLSELEWLPAQYRSEILEHLESARSQRSAASDFIHKGQFPPYYESLKLQAS
jgi:hypothetical protein